MSKSRNTRKPDPRKGTAGESSRRSWTREIVLGAALALIGALIARAVGIIPNPFGDGPKATPAGTVTISEMQQQTLAMFRKPGTPERPGELKGMTLWLQRSSTDTPERGCRLTWSWVDADGPADVPGLVGRPARHVAPDRTACNGPARMWVPFSAKLGDYQNLEIRVEFFLREKELGQPALSETIGMG